MYKQLSKILEKNKTIDKLIKTNIIEYDIVSAGPTAIYYILGLDVYKRVMDIKDKVQRNVYVGVMQRKDKTLYKKIDGKLLEFLNRFLLENKVTPVKFIEANRDALLIYGKVISKTSFDNGIIKFKTKGERYTSLFRIKNKTLLYDSFRDKLKIKGVNDKNVDKSIFVRDILKPMVREIEANYNNGYANLFTIFSKYRTIYMNTTDDKIYKKIETNMYEYNINGKHVESDMVIPGDGVELLYHHNFVEYISPLFSLVI